MEEERKEYKYGAAFYVIILIAIMTAGAQFFGYMEGELLNTYISHVLRLDSIFVGIMVACSATMGLIFMFVFGVLSDNTRSRFGRRAPFLLLGGTGAGIGMILFGFSPNFFWCFILDVIIIGIFSNAFYAISRILVADQIELEYRGRVNSLVSILSAVGIVAPVLLTLLANESFTIPNPDPNAKGVFLTQEGHILLLSIGGIFIIICGIIGFLFIRDRISASELPPKKKFNDALRETFNIKELKNHREFFKLIIAMTIFMSGVSAMLSYLFIFIFSLGISTIELIQVFIIAAPILIVTIIILGITTDRIGRKPLILPTIIISSIGFFMILFITEAPELDLTLLGIAMGLILIGLLGVLVPMNTWSQDLLPEGRKAQFFGIFNIVNTVSQVIGVVTASIVTSSLVGVIANPVAGVFIVAPIFFIISIPFFLKVKETLPSE